MISKKQFLLLLVSFTTIAGVTSCSKSSTNNDTTPQNPIIAADSSEFNGRLKAQVYGQSGSLEQGVLVYLYPSYNDLTRNLSLNYIYTDANGIADFGYLLQGNYYLMAVSTFNNSLRDTVVTQVNSKRETTKQLRLSY